MTTKYLNKDHIIAIHHELIERFGGLHGIRDESLLESAIGRYQSGYYADCVEEAAALMESLGGNHPFIDGNKRIAVTAPFVFLKLNGYEIFLGEEAAFVVIMALFEAHEFTFTSLEPWIRQNVQSNDEVGEKFPTLVIALEVCKRAFMDYYSAREELSTILMGLKEKALIADEETNGACADDKGFMGMLAEKTQEALDVCAAKMKGVVDKSLKAWAAVVELEEAQVLHTGKIAGLADDVQDFEGFMNLATQLKSSLGNFRPHTLFPQSDGSLTQAADRFVDAERRVGDMLEVFIYGSERLIAMCERRLQEIEQPEEQ